MKLTKYGHSCLLVEENNLWVLIDPGAYSTGQEKLKDLDFILITHEHADHVDVESIKKIMLANRAARIFSTKAVERMLNIHGLQANTLKNGERIYEKGVLIEAILKPHTVIYPTLASVDNLSFMIASRLLHPGDVFVNPGRPVEILALPVAGPWLKLVEAIDYASEIKPKMCFPIHDNILKDPGTTHRVPPGILEPKGIRFEVLTLGKEYKF